MNLDHILDNIKDVCFNYMKAGNELPPILFCLKDNEITPIDLAKIPKEYTPSAIADVVERLKPDAVVIATENWMVLRDMGGVAVDVKNINITPSKEPDRIECLVLTAKSPVESNSRMYEIIRKGKRLKLGEMKHLFEVTNRFLDGVFVDKQKMH